MTQTWTGRARPWLVWGVVAAGVAAMIAVLWFAFAYLTPANFGRGNPTVGLTTMRILAVVLCAFFAVVLGRILIAYAPNTVTLSDDLLTVRHGGTEHSIRLADVDAVVYTKTSVQSGSGLFVYPREEYLVRTNSRVRYGHADPSLTMSLQRFSDRDERAVALAVREAVKAAGGRFGTSTAPAEPDDQSRNITRTADGRLRVATPGTRRPGR